MQSVPGQDDSEPTKPHRLSFFAPDRPVDGTTVFVRPSPEHVTETPDAVDD